MNKYLITLAISLLVGIAKTGAAEPVNLPIQLDYGLIKKVVVNQLFKGEGGIAEVWHDKHKCSFLNLSKLIDLRNAEYLCESISTPCILMI